MTVLARPIRYSTGIRVPEDARFTYMSEGGTRVQIPFPLDPIVVLELNVEKGCKPDAAVVKDQFIKLMRGETDRQQRALVSVAYHMLRGSDSRYESSSLLPCDALDCAVTGYTEGLRTILKTDPGARDRPDLVGLTPLYLACRAGFYDAVAFLLQQGADPNVPCGGEFKSTCLHVAQFYKHYGVCLLLLTYGADIHAKNDYGQKSPLEEAEVGGDKMMVLHLTGSKHDLIAKYFKEWSDLGLLHDVLPIKERRWDGEVVARVFPRKGAVDIDGWLDSFHGTRIENPYGGIVSILKHGLKASGGTVDGKTIKPKEGHFQLGLKHDGIDNFPAAIFVSPSVLYATHPCYSDRRNSAGESWCVVLHVKTKPATFTKHKMTVKDKPVLRPGEPEKLEWRIATEEDLIWRCGEGGGKVHVMSVMFIKNHFLKGVGNADEGMPDYDVATKLILGAE